MYNNKFTRATEIAARITRKHKKLNVNINDIIEWCADCEINVISEAENWFLFKDVKLTIADLQALAPCNIHRLLDVMYEGDRIYYEYDGTYIMIRDDGFTSDHTDNEDDDYTSGLRINYYGLPLDIDGRPLILKGHQKACEYYCLLQLYEEPYMNGEIDGQRMGLLEKNFAEGIGDALGDMRNMSRNDKEQLILIMHNTIRDVGFYPVYNLD